MSQAGRDRRIDYIEFQVRDIGAAKAFYGAAFEWTFTDFGPDYCEFNDGGLKGGFAHGTPVPGGALVIVYAEDLGAAQARIMAAGGEICREPYAFPGGRRFHFRDPAGNELAVVKGD